jgi:hypothetical protein
LVNSNLGPQYNIATRLSRVESRLDNLMTTPWLVNASTGSGIGQPGIKIDNDGVHAFNSSDQQITAMLTADGSVTAYDNSGNPVARFGPLTNSNPGNYGVEVLVSGGWVQVGSGTVDWTNVANKPSTFPPTVPIAGSNISGTVASATTASSASHASDSDGSAHAFNYNVSGTSYYAVWVGSDTLLGKNTSSARYKENIRQHRISPERVLALEPVLYERSHNGGVTEYGLVAEQVAEHVPELAQWFQGHIDNVRYDLLSVALLEVVKNQERRIRALEGQSGPPVQPAYHPPADEANNAPASVPEPHPYIIQTR